jgi:hypothetical protein
MSRNLSTLLDSFFAEKAELDERAYNSHIGLEIVLKTGATIPVGTTEFTLTSLSRKGASVDLSEPITFEGKLLSAPDIQFAQGDGQDGGTPASISNLDYLITQLIPEPNRLFDGAQVVVYLCFKKQDETYEGIIYGVGKLQVADGDSDIASVSYVSNMSDPTNTGGGREITQRCLNELGVTTGFSFCPAPDVPSDGVCSKVKDDKVAGCVFWGQEPFFKGIAFYNPNGVVNNYPLSGSGGDSGGLSGGGGGVTGGWNEPLLVGGGGCPDVNSWFRSVGGVWIHGRRLKKGDRLLDHLDRIVIVEKVEPVFAEFRYLIESPETGAKCIFSADHPVLTAYDDEKGAALYTLLPDASDTSDKSTRARILKAQAEAGIYNPSDESDDLRIVGFAGGVAQMTKFLFRITTAGQVLKLSLNAPNIYIAGYSKGAGFAGHNIKSMYSGLEVYEPFRNFENYLTN